jgi:hypothetical protein
LRGLVVDLEKLLADIERYKRDRKKFTIELDHVSDACLEAMNSVFTTKPIEEVDAFLDIVYEGIRSDVEEGLAKVTARLDPRKEWNSSSLMETLANTTRPFLDLMKNEDAREAYLDVVLCTRDYAMRRWIACRTLPYLTVLRRTRTKNAYIKVVRHLNQLLRPKNLVDLEEDRMDVFMIFSEIGVLEYLDVLTDGNLRKTYLQILDSAPEGWRQLMAERALPYLQFLSDNRELFIRLVNELEGEPRARIIRNPHIIKQLEREGDREVYVRLSEKLELMRDPTQYNLNLLISEIAAQAKMLSEGENEAKFLRITEKIRRKHPNDWPVFAEELLPYLGVFDEGSELPFVMMEESSKISERFCDAASMAKSAILRATLVNQGILEDERKRKTYLTAVARVAECEGGYRPKTMTMAVALHCFPFLDIIEDPNDLNNLIHIIRKVRRALPKGEFPGSVPGELEFALVETAPKYLATLRDEQKRRTFYETVFRSGRRLHQRNTFAGLVESVAMHADVLADAENRNLYMCLLKEIGGGHNGEQCRVVLDNLHLFKNEKKRELYTKMMASIGAEQQTRAVAEAILSKLALFENAEMLQMYTQFLDSVRTKQPEFNDYAPLVRGTLSYIEEFMRSTQSYLEELGKKRVGLTLEKIAISLANAPPDIERWLRVGLECIKRHGSSAERYFDYRFKEGSLECKIDELAAIELMLHGEAKYRNRQFHTKVTVDYSGTKGRKAAERTRAVGRTERVVVKEGVTYWDIDEDRHSLRHYFVHFHPANRERKAAEKTRRLVVFTHKLNNLRHVKNAERKESQKRNLKSAFPDLARFVDALADGERPLLKASPQTFLEKEAYQMALAYEKSQNLEYQGLSGESALRSLERRVQEYVNGERGEQYGNIDQFLSSLLTVLSSKRLLGEMRDHPDIAGKEHEGLRDYLSSLITNLTPMELFDRIRIEENACFLDDLVDRTGSCISTDGSDREATLIYKVGGRDKKRKSTEILELNAYHGDKLVTSLGKVLLVHVKDKEDGNKAKLLVEGVIIGPDLKFVFDTSDDRWPWEVFVYEGILLYAKEQGLKEVIFNAEHSGGQQCAHDFVKYAAERVNAHNKEHKRPHRVEYECAEVDGTSVFRLGGVAKSIGDFEYTHHLTRVEPRRRDVERIRKDGWDGECYFDSWYAWHGENVWNNGTGYIRGFELDMRPQPMRILVSSEVLEGLRRTKGAFLGGKGANLAALVGRYDKRRESGKRGHRR